MAVAWKIKRWESPVRACFVNEAESEDLPLTRLLPKTGCPMPPTPQPPRPPKPPSIITFERSRAPSGERQELCPGNSVKEKLLPSLVTTSQASTRARVEQPMAGTGLGIAGLDDPCHRVLLCHDLPRLTSSERPSTCRAFLVPAACRDPSTTRRCGSGRVLPTGPPRPYGTT